MSAVRRMVGLGIASAIFSCLFVLSFGYAQHSPRPHDVRIDVVGDPGLARTVQHALDRAVPGGFDTHEVASEAQARHDLRDMAAAGALISQAPGSTVALTAGALGVPLQQAVKAALGNVTSAQRRPARFVDVVPLPRGDQAGLAPFALELGLLVPALIGAVGFFLVARGRTGWLRVVGAVAYSVVAGVLGALMLDATLGALVDAPWALLGDAVLVAAAVALSVVALHSVFGFPGTALAAGIFFVVGNAVNGSAVPTSMLPGGYRELAPWLPNNAAIHLVRSDVYFGGHGQGGPILTLALWALVSLAVVAVADSVRARTRRAGVTDAGRAVAVGADPKAVSIGAVEAKN